jgi:PAS domain S-box-containing protein
MRLKYQTPSFQNIAVNSKQPYYSEYEAILNNIPDLILKVNLENKVVWCNQSCTELTSLININVLDCSFLDFFKPCKGVSLTTIINDTVISGHCDVDALVSTSTGDRRYQLKCVLTVEGGHKEILIVARDIHERMKNIDLVVQSHRQLQKLIDAFPFLIFLTTPANDYILANKKYCEFFSLSQNKIIDYKVEDILSDNIAEYFLRDNVRLLATKVSVHYEGAIEHKGKNISLSMDKFPLFDEHGNIYAICGVVEDITVQYQLQRQLQQTQKMEAIGQLTGGIAHDFNNILASIMGYTGLMKRTVSKYDDPTTSGYISQINRAGERARDLVQQLLAFSRGDVGELIISSPGELAKDSMDMLASLIPSSINVNLEIKNNLLNHYIEVNPVQFNQSLMNLVINAKDAIVDEKGNIDVCLEYLHDVHGVCNSCHLNFSGQYILLTVTDSGGGIRHDILQRIFDPFFTTKGIGKGSGMGLSMLHGIVHATGGHIAVKTSVNQLMGCGTQVQVFFPVANTEKVMESVPEYDIDSVHNTSKFFGKTILVIDDEPLITSCLTEVLQYEDFKVVSFNNPNEGLAYYLDNFDKISLIITDQTMPGLTGLNLAKKIHDSGHQVPIILCTGYSEMALDVSNIATGVDFIMNKPFKDKYLLKNIIQLMDAYQK